MTQFYDPKTSEGKNGAKKWFHGSKKDQKKLSNETQIRQHQNIIIGVERQKKADIMISYRNFIFKKTPSFENRNQLALIYLPHRFHGKIVHRIQPVVGFL